VFATKRSVRRKTNNERKKMWVIDMIIEKQKLMQRRRKLEVLPEKERRSELTHLDIRAFLEKEKMRRTKERK
jgi:hypothetical protein